MPDITNAYDDYFLKYQHQEQASSGGLSWHDEFQRLLIKTYLSMSEDKNQGRNPFFEATEDIQFPVI